MLGYIRLKHNLVICYLEDTVYLSDAIQKK